MEYAHSGPSVSLSEPLRERFGRYRVLRRLAYGGMAELLLARAPGRAGCVVVKTILPWFADRPELVAMFEGEARLTAKLRHPNIVEVLDVGEVDGRRYFTMEYLEGRDVLSIAGRSERQARPVSVAEALAIVVPVCAALHHAHRHGIAHCDVSPSNVIITREGTVKVIDFGIAQASDRYLPPDACAAEEGTFSRTDETRGKLAYLSPEQIRCEPVDTRTDIFSACIMLWELTTGCRLFERMTEMATLKAIADKDAIPPSVLTAGYPPALEAIVMKGLRRDREMRWPTAAELASELELLALRRDLDLSAATLTALLDEMYGAARSAS